MNSNNRSPFSFVTDEKINPATGFFHRFFPALFLVLMLMSSPSAAAQEQQLAVMIPEDSTYLSRYNIRVYRDNRYEGLRYSEISGQLTSIEDGYESTFWHSNETTRDLRTVMAAVDSRSNRTTNLDELTYTEKPLSGSYPRHLTQLPEYRNFPLLPPATLRRLEGPGIPRTGDSYEAFAYRLVDPLGRGEFTPVQVYVRYIYQGTGDYLGSKVHFINADFALRSDGRLTGFRVQGSNRVRIAVFPGEETKIFMSNTLNEQYQLQSGNLLRLEGFGQTWIRSPRPVFQDPQFLRGIASATANGPGTMPPGSSSDPRSGRPTDAPSHEPSDEPSGTEPAATPEDGVTDDEPGKDDDDTSLAALPDLPSIIPSESGNIEVSRDQLGLKLNIPDIKFAADSAELLPGEISRVDRLHEILAESGQRRILIIGHTADVGNPRGQQQLSQERARRVGELLIERGIQPARIRFEGRGGTEPVGDNATPAGRARNRRVEVIILNQ
ncbi:OmpA family protein [Salinispira pacifica]|uniref:OmpA-like domain-containing protein n=1 Tax=Salinispira pacifica TaxID=1307761 RepID=V5WIZ9_9SPIO|nr:OmpA family protein [Salinispira pacifica]AHC15600.1 hypothetical protein L21SP2_2239 [Salinispira pacifica]